MNASKVMWLAYICLCWVVISSAAILESFNHLRAPGYLADDFRLAGRGRPGSPSAASMMLDIPSHDDVTGRQHLPSPDRVSGTAFLLQSVIRHSHCRCQSSESGSGWKPICLFKGRGAGDLWTGTLQITN